MADKLQFVLPAGRVISGSLYEKQTTDWEGKPVAEADRVFSFGIAVPKSDPNVGGIIGQIYQHTLNSYQSVQGAQSVVQQIQMGFDAPDFAWKIKDGDKPNKNGQVSEHGKGCWIFYFSSSYAINAANSQNIQIDPKEIERGYYADVSVSTLINGSVGRTAGIYLNPQIVRLLGYGEKIVGGPTAAQAFANTPAQLPAGASALPVGGAMPTQGQTAPQGGGMPGQMPQGGGMPGQMPQGGGMPGQMPQGGGMPGQMPQGVTPHHGFVQGAAVQGGGMPGMGNG